MNDRHFIFDQHTAFDLEALPVTKLTKLLRQLGERGDFARVLKAKQITLIEAHPIDQQALALRAIGEDPEQMRLTEDTPHADEAIQALLKGELRPVEAVDDDKPERTLQSAPVPVPLMKARPKRTAPQAAPETPPAPDVPATAPPEDSVLAWEREQQLYAPIEDDGVPELEQVAAMLAKLLIAGRRAIDREMIAEVVRTELARRPNGWSDSD